MSDRRPIGVFDSGVGGLTVLSEIRRRLPLESTIYLGDNARAPYGPRPADEVRRFSAACAAWLEAREVKLLVLACNTATAQALDLVRSVSAVPVVGVVRPGAVAVAAASRTRHVGVVATTGTVDSGAYLAAIVEAEPRTVVSQQACPDLVPLVEAGMLDGPQPERALRAYLGDLFARDAAIDTLLLGCTHYPLLWPLFERVVGRSVSVVDSAFTTALAIEDLLDALGSRTDGSEPGENRILTTGEVSAFTSVAERIFGAELPAVERAAVAGLLP